MGSEPEIIKTHWTSVSGSEIISKSTLTSASKIYIKVTAAADKQIDSHEGQQIIRINESDTIITAYDDLKNGDYYFDYNSSNKYKLTIGFENNNSGSGDGSYVTGKYKVTIQDANNIGTSVTLTFKDASGNITGTVSGITENVAETAIPTETTKVTIAMSSTSLQNARLRWGNTQETELDLIDGIRQDGNITCDINIANGYEFYFQISNQMNVSWGYDPAVCSSDELVEHATIEMVSNKDNPTESVINTVDGAKHSVNLTIGTTYYFHLIPDAGYQISSLKINGVQDISPCTAAGVFEFTMGASNFHFQGIVTEASDFAVNEGQIVGGASIPDNNNVASHGNLRLTVKDKETDSAATENIAGVEGTFGTVDLTLKEVMSKGSANQYWETNSYNEVTPVPISIVVPAGELTDGQTYSVVRNHGGVYEEIPATYNATTEQLTFESGKFSEYTIIKKKGTPESTPSESCNNNASSSSSSSSTEEEPSTPAVTQPTTLGTVVGGTTVKDWNDLDKILATKNVATAKTTTEKAAAKAPIILTLNKSNSTVPVSTIQALQNSDSSGLHLMMGNGASVTISNGPALKNQGAINLSNTVSQTSNSKTIAFANNTKLQTLGALHMSVPKTVKEAKLYYVVNGQKVYLGTFKPINGQVLFPIMQLGTYQLVY